MTTVTIIAYFIAIAIPAFTVYLFIMLDVFGTGKPSTILMCFGWGATGAISLAWILNSAVLDQGIGYDTLTGIAAPIIEEILKSLVLITLIQRPRFRYIVDGAVYGIAVGIGFAMSENLFIYLPGAGEAVLGTAISRTLSTSLMHASASGMVGISLGRLRRATESARATWPLLGIGLAISLHVIYNNVARELEGATLLLIAIGIGFGSGMVIAWQISQGLAEEKKRFAVSLGLNVGVSTGERKAVQQLGGASIEHVFGELGEFFGHQNLALIRHLLVTQANIGILQNNLNGPASDRLRAAWETESADYRREIERIRKELGPSVTIFMKNVFPSADEAIENALQEEMGRFDPTLVHTFDMFMRVSELSETFKPEQLAEMAERLNKIEIFRNVSLANLENLSRAISVQSFEDGYALFNEGDEGNAMHMLEEGRIDIYVRDRAGQEKKLRNFEPGSVVGEFALLDGQPRSARAQAAGPIKVLVLQRETFYRFIQSRPDVVLAMLQYLAEKGRYTQKSVETSMDAMMKIAHGDYATVAEARPTPVEIAQPAVEPAAESVVALEPEAVSAETPDRISSVFSRAAAILQLRERQIRAQMSS
jgi:RsiW-degrading membrane proteinase PrsW (M82 family)/CRP-like cAMP-binding protein